MGMVMTSLETWTETRSRNRKEGGESPTVRKTEVDTGVIINMSVRLLETNQLTTAYCLA
jgi:hypothetical protein